MTIQVDQIQGNTQEVILPVRATAHSFFNPSETRTVITWLQSAFGARNAPGSLLASRRIRDGFPLYNEHDSCTRYPVILNRPCKRSSPGGNNVPDSPESFTPCSGEWPSAHYRYHGPVSRQREQYIAQANSYNALKPEQLLQRRLLWNGFISD